MSTPRIRCAIYTRKSSEEGLDQSFNSLDAQYEACAAYIKSQRHEGWRLVKQRFEDGGISGGTLERPGLLALLTEIEAGQVDRIVVYKIDRLTRSLTDFAKIVDRLEAAGASFVSVTQSFNTATSMGRLTLNMLLSFAQFEREVTAERIRDKIAASKAKGLWMGGLPPLGYDPHPDKSVRGLVINRTEADTVRQLFNLYGQYGCLRQVEHAAAERVLHSKIYQFASGRTQGGKHLSRGAIHKILTNPIYIGRIKHKDQCYAGQHSSIIEQALWDRVQDKLQAASQKRRGTGVNPYNRSQTPLKGKLFDETGDRLTPSYTKKSERRFRYYISSRLAKDNDFTAWRLPAKEIEGCISNLILKHIKEKARSHELLIDCEIAQIERYERKIMGWLSYGQERESMQDG